MKYFFLSYFLVVVTVVSFAGFRGHKFEKPPIQVFPDMDDQAKVKAQVKSHFFADGVGMRHPVTGTVPMGFELPSKPASEGYTPQTLEFTHGSTYYYTGKVGDYYGDGFPEELKVSTELLKRGQERYNIQCAICHGTSGNGKGVFTKYSTVVPADLTGPGFDDASNPAYRPDGKIYDTITNGWNQMGGYGANINVQDRWAIVAYVRALQHAAKNPAK
ncbi:cytochrome c [Verrucomicrobium sp. BvORR034]|jgi:mono/diheme cytochrome c family protein|uniref:c-type cytochrome n=1 Tax=Verrucomicrobium sp. BvORR034 TaxID=1396418 RepID=UPI000679A7D5|nr:cytochrome c [Verrucomicrobium sp. BvORR034]